MANKLEIIPTIFAKNIEDFKNKFEKIKNLSKQIQINISDGKFNPEASVQLNEIDFIKDLNKKIEVQLMCENPFDFLPKCKELGIKKVWIHYESFSCSKKTIEKIEEIKSQGFEVGVAVNPKTCFENIIQIIPGVESLMFMGVEPGVQGQSFLPDTYQKIRRMHDLAPEIAIQVNGGIKIEEIRRLVHNSGQKFCVGSFLNEAEFPDENYKLIKASMELGKDEKDHVIHVSQPYSQITEHIFLGPNRCCTSFNFDQELLDLGVKAEINLEEFGMDATYGVDFYLWIPTKDHQAPKMEQLFVGVKAMDELITQNTKMYVHCELGHTRSPTLVVAYLMYKGQNFDEAFNTVKEKRPSIGITENQKAALEEFAQKLNSN